jgi:amino acid adenylation domain-containing protein
MKAQARHFSTPETLTLHHLSTAQSGIWFAQKLAPLNPCFNIGKYIEIEGPVDRLQFCKAVHQALATLDAAHLRFSELDDGPRQYLSSDAGYEIQLVDLRAEVNPRSAAQTWMYSDLSIVFDLTGGPLYRVALIQVEDARFYWYLAAHHLIIDAYAAVLLSRRVAEIYSNLAAGRSIEPEQRLSCLALLDEERNYRESEQYGRDRKYWLSQHVKPTSPVTLSGRPPRLSERVVHSSGLLPLTTAKGLREAPATLWNLPAGPGASLAAVMMASTAIFLHLATGLDDIVLGMPVLARSGPGQRRIIGTAANMVFPRITIGPADTIVGIMRNAGHRMREALRHQRFPASDLRRELGLNSADPEIAGTVVNFIPLADDLRFADCPATTHRLANWRADDLEIRIHTDGQSDSILLELTGNADHYAPEALDRQRYRFARLLLDLARSPGNRNIGQLDVTKRDDTARSVAMSYAGHVSSAAAKYPIVPTSSVLAASAATEASLAMIWRDVLHIDTIGRFDDFFELGGHSLIATQAISRIREVFKVELPLRALFEARTLESLARRIESDLARPIPDLRPLVDPLHEPKSSDAVEGIAYFASAGADRPDPMLADTSRATWPLSASQERMWIIQSLDPENTAYNIVVAARLTGSLDIQNLSDAFNQVTLRHAVLRTKIAFVEDGPVQSVTDWKSEALRFLDLRHLGSEAWPEALRIATLEARKPFDLARGPVFRASLYKTGDNDHLFLASIHHIAADQWSIGVLGRELSAFYNANRGARTFQPVLLPVTYLDYATWQRNLENSPGFQRQLTYWRDTLADLQPLQLPTDRAYPAVQSLKGSCCRFPIAGDLVARIEKLSHRKGTSLFMTTFAAFATLLHRLTGQTDIAIGVPIANRTQSCVEGLVGTFVNTLVLRADLSGDPEFDLLLHRIKDTSLDAFANQDVSFDRLVREFEYARESGRAPIVQVLFNVTNAPMQGIVFDDFTWEAVVLDRGGSQFELSVTIDAETTRSIVIEYNTELFERGSVERLVGQYLALLESVIAEPRLRLSHLSLLPHEQRNLYQARNQTLAVPCDKTFVQMFEERAAQYPHATAVTFAASSLSYERLNRRANAVANRLRALGVGPGVPVAICVERSLDLLVGLLAIQKSGGAYVPLDPNFPVERLAFMLADSGAKALVTANGTAGMLEAPAGATALDISQIEALCAENPVASASPQDLAYIIYTSGSTGRPKGVEVPHSALVNFLCSMRREPGLTRHDVLAAVTTISFDIAALEMYLPLLVGARIELVPRETASDGNALAALLEKSQATIMQATPSTWRLLIEAGWQGGAAFRAFCGGEALSRELANALSERTGALWNLYGPTETTVWSTAENIEPGDAPISVGRPIANTLIRVLDKAGEPLPIGAVGEICIGGDGLARGYRNLPEMTAERFVPDHGSTQPGARLYRTGDLGRWGADGKLYHLGRMDHQVKIRGFRIELGEIEATIADHPDVRQVVVVGREPHAGDQRLVAYLVYEYGKDLTASEMRRHLKLHLPEYMVPSLFVALDKLPLTPNGKIDRARLPDPFTHAARVAVCDDQPAPGLEFIIAEIWKEILKVDRVGAHDNFFELGGHSLLSLRVVVAVERRTGQRIDPRSLFFQNLRQITAGLLPSASAKREVSR